MTRNNKRSNYNRSPMSKRLEDFSVTVFNSIHDILSLFDIAATNDIIKKCEDYLTDFPYYYGHQVAQVFDLTGDISGSMFTIAESPIINGIIFWSSKAVYKALIAYSNFGASMKFDIMNEFYNPGFIANIPTKFILVKTKWPTLICDSLESTGRVQWPEIRMSIIGDYLVKNNLRPSAEIIKYIHDITEETKIPKELGSGSIIRGSESHGTFDLGKNNLSFKKNDKVIYIQKKFRPVIYTRNIRTKHLYCILSTVDPKSFVASVFGGPVYHNEQIKSIRQKAGMIIEKNGLLSVIQRSSYSNEPGLDFDTSRSCPVWNTDLVQKAIEINWSFEEIITFLAD